MKHCFLLLFSVVAFAQQSFQVTDFGYSSDIVQIQEALYQFDETQNNYVLSSEYVTTAKDAKFQSQIVSSIISDKKLSGEYKYIYDTDGTLKAINYEPITENWGYPIQVQFQYKNGKVSKMLVENLSNTFYEYNTQGFLSKEIQKDLKDELLQITEYSNYKGSKNYTKINKTDESSPNFTKEIYEEGLLKFSENYSGDFNWTTTYTYDKFRNILSQVYDDNSKIEFYYELDKNNNRIKIAKWSSAYPNDNAFTFVKLTYNNGTTSGSTTIDYDFVKKYNPVFRQKDSLVNAYKKLNYPKKNYLNILKNDSDIEVLDAFENDYLQVTKQLKTPDELSLILYNTIDKKTYYFQDFYTEKISFYQWYEAHKLESSSGIFWIKSDDFQVYFYKDGIFLNGDHFTSKPDNSGKHLFITDENGKQYWIKNIDDVKSGVLYPLLERKQ